MRMNFIPTSLSGKLAVGLGVVLAAGMMLEILFAAAVKGDPAVIDGSPLLSVLAAILAVTVTLATPLSFLFGIFAIIKNREWSVCKALGVFYALTILMFMLGEFAFPH